MSTDDRGEPRKIVRIETQCSGSFREEWNVTVPISWTDEQVRQAFLDDDNAIEQTHVRDYDGDAMERVVVGTETVGSASQKPGVCTCGHAKDRHIYGETGCRPGFRCDCRRYEEA